MVGSEPSFRACLAGALGIPVDDLPLPEYDPEIFWRQWLAARNLGLVPIADPAVFQWPGYWIAGSASADGGRDAVLMFGAPSLASSSLWSRPLRSVVSKRHAQSQAEGSWEIGTRSVRGRSRGPVVGTS